jgi:hypothetical protein
MLQDTDSTALPKTFCIIEDRHTVQDFAKLQLGEIRSSIQVSLPRLGISVLAHRRRPHTADCFWFDTFQSIFGTFLGVCTCVEDQHSVMPGRPAAASCCAPFSM